MSTFLLPVASWAYVRTLLLREALVPSSLAGSVYDGPGIENGIDEANRIKGISTQTDVRQAIVNIIIAILDFVAIIAVLMIIIAGIRLIVSQGEEEQKEKAKKTLYYLVIGLIVIVLARVIVGLVGGLLNEFLS